MGDPMGPGVTLLWLGPYGAPYGAWGDFVVVVTLWGTPWL